MSYRYKQGKNTTWRNNLIRNLLTDLIIHEHLTLEVERAKMLKREFDKIVTLAKKQDLASRRRIETKLFIVKMKNGKTAAYKLYHDIANRYPNRNSGYTTIVRLGTRKGDNAEIARIALID